MVKIRAFGMDFWKKCIKRGKIIRFTFSYVLYFSSGTTFTCESNVASSFDKLTSVSIMYSLSKVVT